MQVLDTLIFKDPNNDSDVRVVKFHCSCGSISHARESEVLDGNVKSCGHENARMDPGYFVPKLDIISRYLHTRLMAYYHWEDAGRPAGDGKKFWYSAMREVNKQFPPEKT